MANTAQKVTAITDEELEALELSDEWVTRVVAARRFGVTPQTIHNWYAKKGEVAGKQDDDGRWLYHLGECASRHRHGPSDLGDGSEESKILGRANALLATANRHNQQLMEPSRAVLELYEKQIERLTLALENKDQDFATAAQEREQEIVRLRQQVDELLQEKRRDLAEDQRLQREHAEWERKMKREQDEYELTHQREEQKQAQQQTLIKEGMDMVRALGPTLLGGIFTNGSPGMAQSFHAAMITDILAGITDEQIQAIINTGKFSEAELVKLIELRSQIKKAKAKAEQADKAAKEKAAKDAADQKLADEMKATQEAADKRPQNGNGAASIPPK